MDRNNDKNDQDRDFPGYPHYPANEDITNPGNGNRKVEADVEDMGNSKRSSQSRHQETSGNSLSERATQDDEIRIVAGTEADVTKEDLALLGDRDADQDMGDDEMIRTSARVDKMESEDDLDIPGSELDDDIEEIGEEDEENNYYSLGGDNHDNLEEDPAGGNQDQ